MKCLFCGRELFDVRKQEDKVFGKKSYFLNTWYRGIILIGVDNNRIVFDIHYGSCESHLSVDHGTLRYQCKKIKYDDNIPIHEFQYKDYIYLGFNPPSHIKGAEAQHIRPVDYVDLDMMGLHTLVRKGFKVCLN